jgi:hypothetical protein
LPGGKELILQRQHARSQRCGCLNSLRKIALFANSQNVMEIVECHCLALRMLGLRSERHDDLNFALEVSASDCVQFVSVFAQEEACCVSGFLFVQLSCSCWENVDNFALHLKALFQRRRAALLCCFHLILAGFHLLLGFDNCKNNNCFLTRFIASGKVSQSELMPLPLPCFGRPFKVPHMLFLSTLMSVFCHCFCKLSQTDVVMHLRAAVT